MMNIGSNPEELKHFSLTKCCNIADRIREVGSRHCQEINKLGCNEWTSHSNGNHALLSPTLDDCTTKSTRDLFTPPKYDLSSEISEASAHRTGNVHRSETSALLWDKNSLTNICSNSEEQEHLSLTKCRKVADKIREAGSRHRQEIGNLGSNVRTSHCNEGRAPTSSTPSFCTTTSERDLLTPPTHELSSKISETIAPRSESVQFLESRARLTRS